MMVQAEKHLVKHHNTRRTQTNRNSIMSNSASDLLTVAIGAAVIALPLLISTI